MKHSRQLLCLLLSIFLLLGLFAGCSQEETIDPTTETEPNRDPGSSDITVTEPDGNEPLDDSEKLAMLPNRANGSVSEKEHTVMVYMVGSDLETQYAAASKDLVEMLDSGLDTSKVNLLVYTGGAQAWNISVPSETNNILTLAADGSDFEIVATTKRPVNTGDPDTLSDFLNFGVENFPAESYSLIFWDHGGGSLYGFGSDELFKGDGLFLQELQYAMEKSPFAQEKLAFVGFDACLMATMETASLFSDYADYMVASEELEPGSGWDYQFLSTLNSGSVKDVTNKILSTYETSMKRDRTKPKYTLSCLDLSQADAAEQAIDGLFAAARQDIIDGNYSKVAKARGAARGFGMGGIRNLSDSYDHADLAHLSSLMEALYPQQAQALNTALDKLITKQVTNMENANGVSMYFPYDNKEIFKAGYNLYTTTPATQGYLSFLEVYSDIWLDGTLDTQWPAEMPVDEQPQFLTLTLSQNELDHLSRVYYNLFQKIPGTETYTPISLENRIYADNSGTFTISTDPQICMLKTDLDSEGSFFQVTQTDADTYVSQYAVLMTSDDLLSGQIQPIQISLNRVGDQLDVTGILARDSANTIYARQDVDTQMWNLLTFYSFPAIPTANEDGLLLSHEEWDREDSFSLTGCRYRDEFSFQLANLSSLEGEFYIQIVGEDTRGEIVLTAWDLLRSNLPYTEETMETQEGVMTFRVYADHAELADYNGNDTAITVPDTVGGQPVTVIGEGCVSSGYYLSDVVLPNTIERIETKAFLLANVANINLPEGLTYLGDYAMASYKGESLTLPSTLTHIGYKCFSGARFESITIPAGIQVISDGPFYGCSNLKAINITGSSRYTSVDGVLFAADKKTLIAYPGGAGTSYTVPEGTEVIAHSAFAGNYAMQEVILPETLKVIDNFGFGYCESLTQLQLPESLEVIGQSAFGTDIGMPKSNTTQEISIGKNVRYIGADAFSCFNLTQFQVDPENKHYSSMDGCLLNYGGTTLISVPCATEGSFEVPFGVCHLAGRSLQDCNLITELILPDTVVSIDLEAGVPTGLQKLTVGTGLMVWENVADYAGVAEITIADENPSFTVSGGQITEKP